MARSREIYDRPEDDVSIFEIEKATRSGVHLLIQVFGPSECGKTETGLRLARGIAGPDGIVGCMDTEGRARIFADSIEGGFHIGELTRPFSPKRYLDGIELFIKYGVHALMIDSFSHVWEGWGGVLDQAEQSGAKGIAKWTFAKRSYNRMVSVLLTTRIPIIFCSRAKQPIKIEKQTKNGREEEVWVREPWEPIQDARLKYEMTIVLPMIHHGTYETDKTRLKCPAGLRHLFDGSPLTIETGQLIGQWMAGGEAVNPEHERWRAEAFKAAEGGMAALRKHYETLTPQQADFLKPQIPNLRSAAHTADEVEAERKRNQELPSEDEPASRSPFAVTQATAPRSAGHEQEKDWARVESDMLVQIARATDPGYCAVNGPFLRDNVEELALMQNEDPNRWANIQFELGQRELALREARRELAK